MITPFSAARQPTITGSFGRSVRGLSLLELMVSISIGMIIIAALSVLFSNNSRTRNEIEKSSQRIDNGRFALDLLQTELQNAGYFAEFDPTGFTMPLATPDPCLKTVDDLKAALRLHVQGYNDVATNVLSCLTDVKAGTDVLVIRRANACDTSDTNCTPFKDNDVAFQASSCTTQLSNSTKDGNHYKLLVTAANPINSALNLTKRGCVTTNLAPIRRYLIRIYYVANNDQSGDGIPTLKRAELTGDAWNITSVAPGIENFQLEHGLDVDTAITPLPSADGLVSIYTPAPQSYNSCDNTNGACATQWTTVVSSKITLLSRNTEATRSGNTDSKTYTVGKNADGTNGASGTAKTVGPFNDYYKRSVYQATVRLQNVSNRNATGS